MRIGIDVRCLTEGKRTGVEEYTLQLLEHVFELDHENRYILFCNSWHEPKADFGWIAQYPNVELRLFRWPNKLLNFLLWYIRWPYLDRWLGGVDIFFMPNLNFAAVSRRTRLVVTAHDISFDVHPETFSLKRRLWHTFVNFRGLLRQAHTVVSVSEATRADIVSAYGGRVKHVTVIQSGVSDRFRPIDRNAPELVSVKEKYHLPYKFILFFGTIEPRKNLVALIRAFAALATSGDPELEKYVLVIAGTRGWKCEGIFEEIERSGVKDRILLTGFVAEEDRPALYNLATVFVYPSVYEGFGFPPIEAMACGVPVIASHTSVFPETVGDAGVLVDPRNPEELFLALRELVLDKKVREHLARKGVERARKFHWDFTARKMLKLWKRVRK